jgi:hypothetical protein
MSSRSLVVRRVVCLGAAVAALAGLHTGAALAGAGAAAVPHIGIVVCAREWCTPPQPTPTPSASAVAGSAVSSSASLTFDPPDADVYPSEGFVFVLDNRSPVAVEITDQSGRRVAQIAAGGSATLRAPGAGTYRYTLTSPPSTAPPVLTIVAHDQG